MAFWSLLPLAAAVLNPHDATAHEEVPPVKSKKAKAAQLPEPVAQIAVLVTSDGGLDFLDEDVDDVKTEARDVFPVAEEDMCPAFLRAPLEEMQCRAYREFDARFRSCPAHDSHTDCKSKWYYVLAVNAWRHLQLLRDLCGLNALSTNHTEPESEDAEAKGYLAKPTLDKHAPPAYLEFFKQLIHAEVLPYLRTVTGDDIPHGGLPLSFSKHAVEEHKRVLEYVEHTLATEYKEEDRLLQFELEVRSLHEAMERVNALPPVLRHGEATPESLGALPAEHWEQVYVVARALHTFLVQKATHRREYLAATVMLRFFTQGVATDKEAAWLAGEDCAKLPPRSHDVFGFLRLGLHHLKCGSAPEDPQHWTATALPDSEQFFSHYQSPKAARVARDAIMPGIRAVAQREGSYAAHMETPPDLDPSFSEEAEEKAQQGAGREVEVQHLKVEVTNLEVLAGDYRKKADHAHAVEHTKMTDAQRKAWEVQSKQLEADRVKLDAERLELSNEIDRLDVEQQAESRRAKQQ